VPCYDPRYTFVEKLQTISTKFRLQQGGSPIDFMRHYYDVHNLLKRPEVQEFIGTDAYKEHKDEFDFKAKIWNVPAERMKGGRAHAVPLSDRVVEILQALPRMEGNDHVFPGAKDGKAISNMAMLEKLRGMRSGLTVHGFRSTFRDWAGDRTNYPRDVIEAALAHAIEDETEAAYRRKTAIEKRRRLMADWARYCAQASRPRAEKVVPIGASKSVNAE
jgi:Phage integrase family/Nucleotidyl transferase AbiEii toxin, Type IV TA system